MWNIFNECPGGTSGKEPSCQCRKHKRCGFDPWVGKVPWRRTWQPTLEFLPGKYPWPEEPEGLQSIGSHRARPRWSDLACTHTSQRKQWWRANIRQGRTWCNRKKELLVLKGHFILIISIFNKESIKIINFLYQTKSQLHKGSGHSCN